MIVDLYTQVWSSPDMLGRELAERLRSEPQERFGQFDASPAHHEQATSGVDMTLVFGFRSERLGAYVPNEFVADFVGRNPHHRAGVAGIDPMSANARQQLEEAVGMGFVGVTISPAAQGFHPMHSDATDIYSRCESLGMPVFITSGDPLCPSSMMEFARPMLLDEVARTFPKLRLVVNRLGSPWIDELLALLSKHQHVYADVSGVLHNRWQLYNALLSAMSFGVMEKLLFASGFPRETPAGAIESLYSINSITQGTNLPTVPRSQIRGVIERDALACLGLDMEVGNRPPHTHPPMLRRKSSPANAGAAPASTTHGSKNGM